MAIRALAAELSIRDYRVTGPVTQASVALYFIHGLPEGAFFPRRHRLSRQEGKD